MNANSFLAKFLRYLGIVLMGLTAGFTLLGGVGTSCAAFFPAKFGSMAVLASLQWLYILFVLIGIVLGVLGILATIKLVKGGKNSYRDALIVLIAGVVVGAIHIIVSRDLRGTSMPVDAVVYTTVLTLILFLILRIPAIWQGVDFTKGSAKSNQSAAGMASIVLGLLTLTIQYTMGPTHTWGGVNYADAFNLWMTAAGAACLIFGAGVWLKSMRLPRQVNASALANSSGD